MKYELVVQLTWHLHGCGFKLWRT